MTIREFEHLFMPDCIGGAEGNGTVYVFDDEETMDVYIRAYHNLPTPPNCEESNVTPCFILYGERSWHSYLTEELLDKEIQEIVPLDRNKIIILIKWL